MIIAAVIIAMIAFRASILLVGVQEFVVDLIPGADDLVGAADPAAGRARALVLFGSLYLLFYVADAASATAQPLPQMAGRGVRRPAGGC